MAGYSDVAAGQFLIGFLIHDVSRLRRKVLDKALKPLGITRSQWWVLSNLSRNSAHEMMQTELANVLDVGKVALGGILDRLETAGYIERKADPVDRRAKRIVMTRLGDEVLARIESTGAELNRKSLRRLTTEEVQLAEDILHRMKKRLLLMNGDVQPEQPG